MNTSEVRLHALNLARDITPQPSDPHTLIENALMIERHLLGACDTPAKAETVLPPTSNEDWSGTADDLLRLFDQGNVLICKARQIGLTRLLARYVADKTRTGHSVIFFSPNMGMANATRQMILDYGGSPELLKMMTFSVFRDDQPQPTCGARVDLVVVDGLAYLSYAKETDFLAAVTPMSERFIFASEPAQERGLFYEMWKNSISFQKVALTWHQPLFPNSKERFARFAELKHNLGEERFRNQFECHFRPAEGLDEEIEMINRAGIHTPQWW